MPNYDVISTYTVQRVQRVTAESPEKAAEQADAPQLCCACSWLAEIEDTAPLRVEVWETDGEGPIYQESRPLPDWRPSEPTHAEREARSRGLWLVRCPGEYPAAVRYEYGEWVWANADRGTTARGIHGAWWCPCDADLQAVPWPAEPAEGSES